MLVGPCCCDGDTWLCSGTRRTAQAIHSSHYQPLLATRMLMAPCFLPPAAVIVRAASAEPYNSLPIYPCSAKQQCRADPDTPAGNEAHGHQQNGHLHVEEGQMPVVLSRTSNMLQDAQVLSSPQGLPLDTLWLPLACQNCFAWRGGTAQEHATHTALASHRG